MAEAPIAIPSKNILVPIDGSKTALRALDHAASEARGRGAQVHLVNVEPPLDDYGTVGAYLTPKKHKALTSARGKALLEAASERLKRAGVRHDVHLVWGSTAESIVRTARRLGCNAIVMGTRGMTATGNLLMGSTATKVVHLATVPVTLVK